MDKETAKREVKAGLEEYLQREHGIRNTKHNFSCIFHADRKPSASIEPKNEKDGLPRYKCFSCGFYGDTFDIIKQDYGLSDNRDIFLKGFELFNLDVDYRSTPQQDFKPQPAAQAGNQNQPKNEQQEGKLKPELLEIAQPVEKAYTALKANTAALEHFTKRGISQEIIDRYKLGYSGGGYNAMFEGVPTKDRHTKNNSLCPLHNFVLPYLDKNGKPYYFQTEISDRTKLVNKGGKYWKIKNVKTPLWNERYLQQEQPPQAIYICEGLFDGLSVETAGGYAVVLGGTGESRIREQLEKYKPQTTFILALDNDTAGGKGTQTLKDMLDELGYKYIEAAAQAGKDYNDFLLADQERFKDFIQQTAQEAIEKAHEQEIAERESYLETSALHHIGFLKQAIEASKKTPAYSTGFFELDELMDGGIYPGLYFVGAISSLGKTTFCLQIMDTIAQAGHDVLVFSLEMSRYELMSKSISRLSFLEDRKINNSTKHARTTRGIMQGSLYKDYSQQTMDIIDRAEMAYMEYSSHIYITEGIGDIGVDKIREKVKRHIRLTGNRPVVLIDYVQILSPYDVRASDKQNTDKAVLELKRMSRDENIPVIGISSFNRENYKEPVSMASFKESGAIEYGTDVLIGLQYLGMDYQQETDKARAERIRNLTKENNSKAKAGEKIKIHVKILKNRNGGKGEAVLDFYPNFNIFESEGAGEPIRGQEVEAGDLNELFS